jgi:GH24 family phage-related lysozyme (muramidase)
VPRSRVSDRAYKLIVDYETGGRAYYETVYKKRPVWPKEASGITIGFGYDLGYVSKNEFERDWAALAPEDLALLGTTVGMRGKENSDAEMKAALTKVKGVTIEWEQAERVFASVTLPKFETLTSGALPNTALLSGDSFGALVSLSFNRGAAYSRVPKLGQQDRWVEMRAIHAAMDARRFGDIPGLLRAMIPLWKGTAIEIGMTRRRTDEATLFQTGLAAERDAVAEARDWMQPATAAAGSAEPLDDAEKWPDQTDAEVTEESVNTPAMTLEVVGVSWSADADSPDYAHLAQPSGAGLTFSLTAEDVQLLATQNAFALDPAEEPVLFGLRGAVIITDHTHAQGIILKDLRPDHETPRCVLGVWDRAAGTIAVFPGSTVPNAAAVRRWRAKRDMGNILATGCYGYVVGTHNGKPGCFLLRETIAKKRKVVVRRSSDDLTYNLGDLADLCAPGDNIHPTFRSNLASFSSVGCQTVVGNATTAGNHSGPWATFRSTAGLPKTDGTRFTYMLLTGAEARLASELRRNGLAADPVSTGKLRRLRFGSKGDLVVRLQARLGIEAPDDDFGPTTSLRLHERQRGFPGASGSDGIYPPRLDEALGWAVFRA